MKNYATQRPDASGATKDFDDKLSSRNHRTQEAHAECHAAIEAYEVWLTTDDSTGGNDEAGLIAAPRRRTSRRTCQLETLLYAKTFGIEGLLEQFSLDHEFDAGDLS